MLHLKNTPRFTYFLRKNKVMYFILIWSFAMTGVQNTKLTKADIGDNVPNSKVKILESSLLLNIPDKEYLCSLSQNYWV